MKEIIGLDTRLEAFVEVAGVPSPMADQMPTFKNLIRNSIALATLRSRDKALIAYDLNEKLKDAGDTVQVDDREINVLREAIEQNPMQLTNHMWAQLIKKANSARPVAVEPAEVK